MNVVTRGIRNAFRNVVRTVSIVVILGLSIGLSLSMLVAHQAVGQKIASVQKSIGNTVNVSPAGLRGFDGGGNALTASQLAGVAKIDHVSSVNKMLMDRLDSDTTNLKTALEIGNLGKHFAEHSGFAERRVSLGADGPQETTNFTPPITVVGTTTPADVSGTPGGGTFSLQSGKAFDSASSENVALVGSALATKNNLKVGSTFTAYNTTITVVGIFDAGNSFSNNQVIMPLTVVQKLTSQPDAISSATITVDSVNNIDAVTAAVKKALGSAADVTNSAEQAKQTIQPLQNIQAISLYSLVGAVAAGAVIILLAMVMIVRERRREIGVLKAIGASNGKIVGQFMTEAITLTGMSAVLGIGLGVLAANPITKLLVSNSNGQNAPGTGHMGGTTAVRVIDGPLGGLHHSFSNIHAVVGWSIIAYGFAAAMVIALAGSALASFFIAKIRPAEVMRTE